jgi:simple sugar transport system permease protein
MEWFTTVIYLLSATIRVSTPLIFCAMAGLISERSGVIDIGLEGKMLGAAFAAGVVAAQTGSAWDGLAAAVVVSALMSLLHGFACITHRGDQVVSGVAINIIAAGLTVVLGNAWFARGGETPQLDAAQRFMPLTFPGTDNISHLPLLGALYVKVLSGQSLLTYIAFLLVPAVAWLLYRSRVGL